MIHFEMLRQTPYDALGFIPHFLSEHDKTPAKVQFNQNYISGWPQKTPMKDMITTTQIDVLLHGSYNCMVLTQMNFIRKCVIVCLPEYGMIF